MLGNSPHFNLSRTTVVLLSRMSSIKLAFHFEQATSEAALKGKEGELGRDGWKAASEIRRVDVTFATGRRDFLYSQGFVRPALFPVCQRLGATLPARFEVLTGRCKPCEHLVHFYRDEKLFLDSLESFIVEGLMAGDAVVVIALPEHRSELEERLHAHGLDLDLLEKDQQLAILDAQLALSSFLVQGMPNEMLFERILGGLLAQMRQTHKNLRAFGEMVGILWAQGNQAATVSLEEIWHRYCAREGLMLYCAYPLRAFKGKESAIRQIQGSHSRCIEA